MKKLSILALVAGIAMIASVAMASVPPPPVNQTLGFEDIEFNALTEADCRVCHNSGVPDRHHMLYGSAMPDGVCSATTDPTPRDCYTDADCVTATPICSNSGDPCVVDADCPRQYQHPVCTTEPYCAGTSAAANVPGSDNNGGVYGCLTCHSEDTTGGVISFVVYRDCLFCHVQLPNSPSVHHLDETVTLAKAGQCTICHGDIVDDPLGCMDTQCAATGAPCVYDADCDAVTPGDSCEDTGPGACDDGHIIPTYAPSLVTPAPVQHEELHECSTSGDPCVIDADCPAGEICEDVEGPIAAGGCAFCHNAGTDTASGLDVLDNHDNHHGTGVYKNRYGGTFDGAICEWCHKGGNPHSPGGEDPDAIRNCENCHGLEALHNIQADSPNAANIGTIVVGGEDAYYGHIGRDNPADPDNDSDCWGCHGFSVAADDVVLGSGVPSIYSVDPIILAAGTDTAVAITGAALSNGALSVTLTAADGSVTTLAAADVTDGSLTASANLAAGTYALQAVKDGAASNAIAVTVVPAVAIADMDCSKCLGTMTITGSGFAGKPAGTDEAISVTEGGRPLNVINWSDTEITVSGARCRGDVQVNSVYGSSQ